jgi:peptidoglycan/LPS O-acetylase OafA/YrhL
MDNPLQMSNRERVEKHTFVLLDGLRGIAAISVVLFHGMSLPGHRAMPHGYMAVDFFFLLSGFVIAYAYQTRLDGNWSTLQFLKVRVIRLAPLYLLGLVISLIMYTLRSRLGHYPLSPIALICASAFALVLLPTPKVFAGGSTGTMPLNFPTWSLSLEIFGNVVHAFFLRNRSTRWLVIALAISSSALVGSVLWRHSIDVGPQRSTFFQAIPRLLVPYLGGMLLCRLYKAYRPKIQFPALALFLVLVAIFMIPDMTGNRNEIVDLAIVFLAFPLLLIAAAASSVSGRMAQVCKLLGKISYPVYVLHIPLRLYLQQALPHIQQHHSISNSVVVTIFLTIALAISYFADRWDAGVRGALTRRFVFRSQPVVAPAAKGEENLALR